VVSYGTVARCNPPGNRRLELSCGRVSASAPFDEHEMAASNSTCRVIQYMASRYEAEFIYVDKIEPVIEAAPGKSTGAEYACVD
jgi:hypothetical protein